MLQEEKFCCFVTKRVVYARKNNRYPEFVLKAYKNYKGTGSMSQYNADVDGIIEKYRDDHAMLNFCKNLVISWAPVINEMKEDD